MSLSPIDVRALAAAGRDALREGDAYRAREAFERLVAQGLPDAEHHLGVAQACLLQGDPAAALAAVDGSLALAPRYLPALMFKADWFAAQGDDRAASSHYQFAIKAAPPDGQLPPELRREVERAREMVGRYARKFEQFLVDRLRVARGAGEPASARFTQSLDILLGKKQIFFQQPQAFYFAELPQIQFYDRSHFRWMDAVEAATDAIRGELDALLAEGSGFKPYVEGDPRRPRREQSGMTDNPDWSAFYLWKYGQPVPENLARCPQTAAALAGVPFSDVANRSPSILFSQLKPGARIPPHSGLVNTRLICHLPLIVPPGCGFRVGNDTRTPVEGKAWAFDDTIEHEAWNNSDHTRVILLFEVWRPELSMQERGLVRAMFESIDEYSGQQPSWEHLIQPWNDDMHRLTHSSPEVDALEAKAMLAAQAGRESEAVQLWTRILELDPDHTRTLNALGQRAFRQGEMPAARAAFQRIVDADGTIPQQWIQLAIACRNLYDEAGEEQALHNALRINPKELAALILRANFLERTGRTHEASLAYGAVAAVAPPLPQLPPDLRPAVTQALAHVEAYNRKKGEFLDAYLDQAYRQLAGENLYRFRTSVDILVGRKKRFDSQSLLYHFPNLAPIEFFDRGEFPWLAALEAATDAIRDEFLAVLATDEGFTPYVAYPEGTPVNQFAELNHSPRWSALHLYEYGKRVAANADRCPKTMAALAHVPQPDQAGRTPTAMFSLLKPRTTIPAHVGVSNVRVVTHLALIIPQGCSYRVGNDVRKWVAGKAWVFDDTIEHEARNDSDELRVILMCDVWHPHLTPPERALITALSTALNDFEAGPANHPF